MRRRQHAQPAADRVIVGPRRTATVTVAYTVPPAGGTRTCHLRASPDGGESWKLAETSDF